MSGNRKKEEAFGALKSLSTEFDFKIGRQEDVGWLDISMQNGWSHAK